MKIRNLPFHIGPTEQPSNPSSLPNSLDLEFRFDRDIGALRQVASGGLNGILRRAYELGISFGTPLTDDSFGKPYADDFLAFLARFAVSPGRACEIGAGAGYVSRRLIDSGWLVTSLEPGQGYAGYWKQYAVDIVRDFFPSPHAPGPFDLICCYGVLEHVEDPVQFLKHVREHLAPAGVAIFSVPDCTGEIQAGDPSMLLHEHFTYFNGGTLGAVLAQAGFDATVAPSGYGRCLYAAARPRQADAGMATRDDLPLLDSYPERTERFIARARERLSQLIDAGSVGIYCPARALALLDPAKPMRFFDDDQMQRGKYLPPFPARIEGRQDLLAQPVETVVIMSRTFGERIRASLLGCEYGGAMLTVNELI